MKYLSLVVFVVSTAFHLYASWHSNKKLRDVTKPFILTSLLAFYAFSVEKIRWVIVLALIFSWIGDLFLIKKGVKWFAIGGISFLISHLFFIITYSRDVVFSKINIFIIIALAVFFLSVVTWLFKHLKGSLPKGLLPPMYLYLLTNGAMNCFAIFRMLSCMNIATITTCVGAILFFASDSALFFVRFKKDFILKTHFFVMLTYSIGEFLIVLGLIIH